MSMHSVLIPLTQFTVERNHHKTTIIQGMGIEFASMLYTVNRKKDSLKIHYIVVGFI